MLFYIGFPLFNESLYRRRNGEVFGASASQLVDIGSILLSNHTENFIFSIQSFFGWGSVQRERYGGKADKFASFPWMRHLTGHLHVYVVNRKRRL